MKLSARNFPHSITRKRQAAGSFNDFGEFVAGSVQETVLRASIQPLDTEEDTALEGARLDQRLKVFVPTENALAPAFDQSEADTVLVDGVEYVVEKSRSWRGSHTRAILLR